MMHTGDHRERRARAERALALHDAWQELKGWLRLRRPGARARTRSGTGTGTGTGTMPAGLPFSAGSGWRG